MSARCEQPLDDYSPSLVTGLEGHHDIWGYKLRQTTFEVIN